MEQLFESFQSVSKQQWKDKIEQDLKGAQYDESVVWKSDIGIEIQPFYHLEDLEKKNYQHFEFKRQKSSVLGQYFKFNKDAEALNKQILSALQFNVSSVSIDLQNQAISKNEILKIFDQVQSELLDVTFLNIEREKELFEILLASKFHASSGCIASKNIDWKSDYSKLYQSSFRKGLIDLTTIGNESASIVFELALALSKGVFLLDENEIKEGPVQFNFIVAGNYFFEIAKLRAFRFLWRLIAKENDLSNQECFIQCQLARYNKSETDASLNILRATTEAMSVIIGGCDAIILNTADEFDKDDRTKRIYNNVFNILNFESNMLNVSDASAGSYYIESLTEKIAKLVWQQFMDIEDAGGYGVFSKTEKYVEILEEGKKKSSAKINDIETERNLYQT